MPITGLVAVAAVKVQYGSHDGLQSPKQDLSRAIRVCELARDKWSEKRLAFEIDMLWHILAEKPGVGAVAETEEILGDQPN